MLAGRCCLLLVTSCQSGLTHVSALQLSWADWLQAVSIGDCV